MTFQRFLHWLFFSGSVIDELKIYEQTDYYGYAEYKGTFESILDKKVDTIDLRVCHDHMIVSVFIK